MMNSGERAKSLRIQFDLEPELVKQFDLLASNSGCASRKELFSNMITLFAWAVERCSEGKHVASIVLNKNSGWQLPFDGILTLATLEFVRRRKRQITS